MIRLQNGFHSEYLRHLVLALSVCSVYACSNNLEPATPPTASNAAGVDKFAADQQQLLKSRRAVSVFELDESGFRINGLRVGMQDFMNANTPVIIFFLPELADSVEILRCRADTIIRGSFDNLQDVDLGTSSLADETKSLQSNDFWKAASKTDGCLEIAQNYTDKELFLDSFALSGSYRYIVRACVDGNRMTDTDKLDTNRNCSKQVGISPVLKSYVNTRAELEIDALQKAAGLRMRADALGRELYAITIRYNNAESACHDRNIKAATRAKKTEAISAILGAGISLGATVLGGGAVTSLSTTTSFQGIWNAASDSSNPAALVAGALNNLFASPDNYIRSCSAAGVDGNGELKQLTLEGQARVIELKSTQQQYLQAVASADKAKVDRKVSEKRADMTSTATQAR